MRGKRARPAAHTTSPSKRQKKNPARQLLDLPREVLDLILGYTVDAPGRQHHVTEPCFTLRGTFTAPVTQTCRDLRAGSLAVIKRAAVWIRVVVEGDDVMMAFQELGGRLPFVPSLVWSRVGPFGEVVEVCLTDRKGWREDRQRTRSMQNVRKAFVLPFIYDWFCLLVAWISDEAEAGSLRTVLVRWRPEGRVWDPVITARVFPVLLGLRNLRNVEFDVPDEVKPDQATRSRMCFGREGGIDDVLGAAEAVWRTSEQYEAEGYSDEAGLKLLYGYHVCHRATDLLPVPIEWEEFRSYENFEIEATKFNRLRQLIHKIEYGACLAYVRFYERFGIPWALRHLHFIDHGYTHRWIDEPDFTWFGLYSHELGQVHHAKALATRIRHSIRYYTYTYAQQLASSWDKLQSKPFYDSRINVDVATDMFFASWLQPDNTEYEKLWKQFAGRSAARLSKEARRRQQTVLDDNGVLLLKADFQMINNWGDPGVLQHLPSARIGLNSSSDLEIKDVD